MPSAEALQGLGLKSSEASQSEEQQRLEEPGNPFASLIPWLTSMSASGGQLEKAEEKPARYLVAKGLPTLPTKLVEKIWNFEFVEMEEFLPAPRSLRIAEQGSSSHSFQDSLVGALSQFQAQQQHKSQRRVMDITSWVRCFSLYIAVLSKKAPEMVPSMVAHLHTVLHLQQKTSHHLSWLEYDIQFRMEMAASADRAWTCGDPWQYVACLPGQHVPSDPFQVADVGTPTPTREKGKCPLDPEGERGAPRPPLKKQKTGVRRLHNNTAGGCPYGRECIFIHRCTGCGAMDEHGRISCTTIPITPVPGRGGQEYLYTRQGPVPRK